MYMKRIKIVTAIAILLFCPLLLASCIADVALQSSAPDEQEGPWRITVLGCQATDTLNGTQESLQYSGENVTTDIEEKAGEGNAFVLLSLKIEKTQSGAPAFAWEKLTVEDEGGNGYHRCENDSFLENYGYERIKSTDLTLGVNEGYICFELPIEAAQGMLTLVYESETETLRIPLN